ncbi:hypothetical protein ACLX1H_003110 [Fusarium chlamydosporum]
MPVNEVDRAQERKDRKRAQNRFNQRARRDRMRIETQKGLQPGKRPYRVDRWRLGTADTADAAQKLAKLSTDAYLDEKCSIISNEDGKTPSSQVEEVEDVSSQALARVHKLGCSISPDHSLIHLIGHNFVESLVGDFVYIVPPDVPKQTAEEQGDYRPKEDTGLILWGEPHLSESWEATPRFLARWSWVIGECTDLNEERQQDGTGLSSSNGLGLVWRHSSVASIPCSNSSSLYLDGGLQAASFAANKSDVLKK